jgi:hypothetical protein
MSQAALRNKLSASSKSPEREQLAEAIKAHADAVATFNRVSQAKEEASEVSLRASAALTRAQAVLAEAKVTEGSRLASVALGEQSALLPVAEAELAVTQATNDRTVAKNTLSALEAREETERRAVDEARRAIDSAVSDVVRSDPTTQKLAADQEEINRRLATNTLVLNCLTEHGCNPLSRWGYDQQAGLAAVADQWRVAIAALRTDADAELPV